MFFQRAQNREGLWHRTIRPERVMCIGFLLLIMVGGVLLALPVSAADGSSIGLGAGMFTATSAVCVTGLIVVDTGTAFSPFGQVVLIVLIQTGGLGFMVFATLVMAALGRRITLRNRLMMRESMNTATLAGLVRLTAWYGLMTLVMEAVGAAVLCMRFVPLLGWRRGVCFSVWHAVSAFCNAGFDLFGGFASLTAFSHDPLVLLTIAGLVILGGTGFAVLSELMENRFRWRRLSLHARLVLVMTAILLLAGTVYVALAEWSRTETLGAIDGTGNRLVNAFFQSATMRTAGFNSIDLAALTDGTKLVSVLLMLIGANSASTGGGVKTTTVAVLLLAVWSVIRGEEDIRVMGRRLSWMLVRRALAVVTATLVIFLTGTLALTIFEGGRVPFIDILFETASAVGTVGVTSAGTSALTPASRLVLAIMMYLGRVGPLTMALALARREGDGRTKVRYPEENVTIG